VSGAQRAVLGFQHPDGRVGFCCTSAPLVYLRRLQDGTYRSRHLSPNATLRWVLRTDNHAEGIRLRDLLNASARDEAIGLAKRYSAPSPTILALRALAIQHAAALADGRTDIGHVEAWRLLEAATDLVAVVDEPGGNTGQTTEEPEPIDCPFAPLPEPGGGRTDIEVWADVSEQSFRLAIFDLDGTLLDTSMLDDARAARDWQTVRERLDEVRAFPAWGRLAPHELAAELRDHDKQIAVVTRAPGWYAEELLRRFDIHADHVVAACGTNKAAGFRQALGLAACDGPVDTIVFGDDQGDFFAATAIQAWTFGNPWVNPAMTHFAMPDIAWWDAETLLAAEAWRPVLGYLGEAVDGHPSVWHRGSLLQVSTDAWALGRYFPSHRARHDEALSQAVLAQKDRTARVERIAVAFDQAVERMRETIPVDAVVSVPMGEGRVDRFSQYRRAVQERTAADEATVITERTVPNYYKGMTKAERRRLREGRFSVPDDLAGLTVLIIDDVINTGSTIGALADAVQAAGASRVLQLVFAANQSP
jgi:predicted amidophosphoribosyltransferase/FMN phosphatase YigB (HAD superfamily)